MNTIDWRHLEAHPYADIFPRLEGDALRALIDDITQHGLREPITLYRGQVLDGRNRLAACREAGVVPTFREALAETDADALREALSLNLHRRHLTTSQRARIAADVEPMFAEAARERMSEGGRRAQGVANWPPVEPRKARDDAADALNVSPRAVQRAKVVKQHAVPELDTLVRGGQVAVSRAASIATAKPEEQREIVERISGGEKPKQAEEAVRKPHVSRNSGNNEWYTPPKFIEAARLAMGGIDLDPASSEIANRTVQAATFYTAEDDGLRQDWHGKVWMNPPYSQPLIADFCERVANLYAMEEIEQACVLVNNATETKWFQTLLDEASCVCFPSSRIKFLDPDGQPNGAPLQGQAIVYFGDRLYEFVETFRKFGAVVEVAR